MAKTAETRQRATSTTSNARGAPVFEAIRRHSARRVIESPNQADVDVRLMDRIHPPRGRYRAMNRKVSVSLQASLSISMRCNYHDLSTTAAPATASTSITVETSYLARARRRRTSPYLRAARHDPVAHLATVRFAKRAVRLRPPNHRRTELASSLDYLARRMAFSARRGRPAGHRQRESWTRSDYDPDRRGANAADHFRRAEQRADRLTTTSRT